jgi:hypothetical protein
MSCETSCRGLGSASGFRNRGRGSSLKGQKVPIKYRDRSGNTWAGRGAQPVWLREKLKGGAKLEDFAVGKTVASRKASPRKTRRRAKRRASAQELVRWECSLVTPAFFYRVDDRTAHCRSLISHSRLAVPVPRGSAVFAPGQRSIPRSHSQGLARWQRDQAFDVIDSAVRVHAQ